MADNDKVILSEEPQQVRINIQDPNKPKPVSVQKIPQKPSLVDRAISGYFGQDVNRKNLGDFIVNERLKPIGLRMLNNVIQSTLKSTGEAAQMMIFGKVVNSGNTPTDYTSFSNPNVVQNHPIAYKLMDQVETFAFASKNDAENCLNYLRGRISAYGSTSVLDYYERIGQPLDYNMANRGWKDLSNARILNHPNGFVIDFPNPIALKNG